MNCTQCKYKCYQTNGIAYCATGNEAFAVNGENCEHFLTKPVVSPSPNWEKKASAKKEVTPEAKAYFERLNASQKEQSDYSLQGLLNSLDKNDNQTFAFHPYPISFEDAKKFFIEIHRREVLKLQSKVEYPQKTVDVIKELIAYFIGQNDSLLPTKGIYLFGEPGRSKSLIMQCFSIFCNHIESKLEVAGQRFTSRKFTIDSCKSIVLRVAEEKQINSLRKLYTGNICLGDIGAEDNYKLFGNETNVILDILTERYDRLQSYLLVTHGTGNLAPNADALITRYDERIESRFNQLFHYVHLDGPDFRKL